jgi:hypothetical protein
MKHKKESALGEVIQFGAVAVSAEEQVAGSDFLAELLSSLMARQGLAEDPEVTGQDLKDIFRETADTQLPEEAEKRNK